MAGEYTRSYSIKGLFQWIAGFIPQNLNPKKWLVDSYDIHGGTQVLSSIDQLIAFHPFKMKKGQEVTITDYPAPGTNTKYVLNTDPATLVDLATEESLVTLLNWRSYWDESTTIITTKNRVTQYTTDYNGGVPPYPYNTDDALRNEKNWESVLNRAKGHKWERFRDNDVYVDYVDPDNPAKTIRIYTYWTVPLPIGNPFASGDYIANMFKRQAISATHITSPGSMVSGNWYSVELGGIIVTSIADPSNVIEYGKGQYFKYVPASYTYQFDLTLEPATYVVQIPEVPSRTLSDGTPNNTPSGWEDKVPIGSSDQLWKIWAQKSIYGQLKSEWFLEKVIESPEYLRYSNNGGPDPNTLVPTDKSIADMYVGTNPDYIGKTYDQILTLEGWVAVNDEQIFIAQRFDPVVGVPGPPFTQWSVEKIGDESGEYDDYVYKLFDLNADYTDVLADKPTLRDPSSEGWFGDPLVETADTTINYVSHVRKYFDGTLKGEWSDPVPYTGQSIFIDAIDLPNGDSFKYDPNSATPNVPVPTTIQLIAELVKGKTNLWENPDNIITYKWEKIFDGGAVIDPAIEITSTSSSDPAYLLPAAGTYRDNQILVIKPAYVDGKAFFRLTQTLTTPSGDIVFIAVQDIIDITDGIDSVSLEIGQLNSGPLIYDTVHSGFAPSTVQLRIMDNNLPSTNFKWFVGSVGSWVEITGAEASYDISADKRILVIYPHTGGSPVFANNDTLEERTYAATTATNPDLADFATTWSDYYTVHKVGNTVGPSGESPVLVDLVNEHYATVLNGDNTSANYGKPITGEIGSTGKARTDVRVSKAGVTLVYNTDYTVVISPQYPTGDFNFDIQANAPHANVYVRTWNNPGTIIRSGKCVITVTIVSSGQVITKEFSLSSSLDMPGAIILDVDCSSGFVFNRLTGGMANKTLVANLYGVINGVQTLLTAGNYYWRWYQGTTPLGAWTLGGNSSPAITRASILVTADITVKVSSDSGGNPVLRAKTNRITDLLDGKIWIWYSTSGTLPATPADTYAPDTPAGGWSLDSAGAIYASEAQEVPGTANGSGLPLWRFKTPYRIKGEAGSQGGNGGFLLTMYKNFAVGTPGTVPSSTADLNTMEAASWTYVPPAPSAGYYLWLTQRLWEAFDGGNNPVTFNGAGRPNTNPKVNSYWHTPSRLSGSDGVNGNFVEFRYAQNNSSSVPPTIVASDRAPTGWTTVMPTRVSGQFIWQTKAVINGTNGNLVSNWETPQLNSGYKGDQGVPGVPPDHQWNGTQLRFKNPDGSWGSYVDLKGIAGPDLEAIYGYATSGAPYVLDNVAVAKRYIIRLFAGSHINLGVNVADGTEVTVFCGGAPDGIYGNNRGWIMSSTPNTEIVFEGEKQNINLTPLYIASDTIPVATFVFISQWINRGAIDKTLPVTISQVPMSAVLASIQASLGFKKIYVVGDENPGGTNLSDNSASASYSDFIVLGGAEIARRLSIKFGLVTQWTDTSTKMLVIVIQVYNSTYGWGDAQTIHSVLPGIDNNHRGQNFVDFYWDGSLAISMVRAKFWVVGKDGCVPKYFGQSLEVKELV